MLQARIEPFSVRLARPQSAWFETLEAALREDGRLPLRWAVTAVEDGWVVVEGARMVTCSTSST